MLTVFFCLNIKFFEKEVGLIKIQKSRTDGIVAYKNSKFADIKKIKPFYNGKSIFYCIGFD